MRSWNLEASVCKPTRRRHATCRPIFARVLRAAETDDDASARTELESCTVIDRARSNRQGHATDPFAFCCCAPFLHVPRRSSARRREERGREMGMRSVFYFSSMRSGTAVPENMRQPHTVVAGDHSGGSDVGRDNMRRQYYTVLYSSTRV
jgi:hypothetical protein